MGFGTASHRETQSGCKWCSHIYMFIHPDQLGEQTYLRPYIQSPLSPVHSVSSLKGRYAHPMGHLVRTGKIQIVVLFTKEPHGISSKVKVMTLTHITISVEDFSELNGSSDVFCLFLCYYYYDYYDYYLQNLSLQLQIYPGH